MKGYRQGNVGRFLREAHKLRHQATGGYRDISRTYVHSLRRGHEAQKFHYLIVVVQRLSAAHEHYICDGALFVVPMGYVLFGAGDKAEHLPRLKIAYTAFKRGSTECAAHAAAHLSRYAHGVAVVIAHKHALDYIAVLKLKQVLYSTVLSRHPFIIYACAAVMEPSRWDSCLRTTFGA